MKNGVYNTLTMNDIQGQTGTSVLVKTAISHGETHRKLEYTDTYSITTQQNRKGQDSDHYRSKQNI